MRYGPYRNAMTQAPSYDIRPFDHRFDLLVVEGREVGFIFREKWDLSTDGEELVLLLGNTHHDITQESYTVSAATIGELVRAILKKTAEVTQGQRAQPSR